MPIRVIVVDDHGIMRQGICTVLKGEADIEVVGEAASGEEALDLVDRLQPDLVVMDIGLPGISGIEATRRIKARHPDIHVVGLTMHEDEPYVLQLLRAGAEGYIIKRSAAADLVTAVRLVAGGEAILDPAITRSVIKSYIAESPPPAATDSATAGGPGVDAAATDGDDPLTPRELEVLVLVAQGLTNSEIADQLFISVRTVQTHRSHILEKLGLHDRIDLVKYAIRRGLLRP